MATDPTRPQLAQAVGCMAQNSGDTGQLLQLRATVIGWAEQIALHPQMMVKTPFEALQRVVLEIDRLREAEPPAAPQEQE